MAGTFGQTADGAAVRAVVLRGGGLVARLLTLGSILHSLRLDGVAQDLTLGGTLADYRDGMRYHGAIVGPVANRIAGARAEVGGRVLRLEANEGAHSLHGGHTGTHGRIWRLEDAGDDHARLSIALPDGLGGYPGNRRITARWDLRPPATLRLTLTATTDAPTLMNPAQHSYWNLDGSPTWAGHRLRIAADRWVAVDAGLIPRAVLPVAGTAMDFRAGRRPVPGDPPLDHTFCLADGPRGLTEVLWLTGRAGVTLTLATTAPGVQVFDGGDGHAGLALEPQHWPDAPGRPDFPPILLLPGQEWRQTTEWRFACQSPAA